ncbi:MAG: hypothetical protein VX346_18100 [Planctomycetota bacterium]|nr:hypothetical protein [Planctomycetota bacterium]
MTTVENDKATQLNALTEFEQRVIRQLSRRLWTIGVVLLLLSTMGAMSEWDRWQSRRLVRTQQASRQSVDSDADNQQTDVSESENGLLLLLAIVAVPTFRAAWNTTKATRHPGPDGRRELMGIVLDLNTIIQWVFLPAFLGILFMVLTLGFLAFGV